MQRYITIQGPGHDEITFFPDDVLMQGRWSEFFRYIYSNFPYYRDIFQKIALAPDMPPVEIIKAFPSLARIDYRDKLQLESLRYLGCSPFVHDRSSGSYAQPVIRYSSWRDEMAEELLTVRAFELFGIGDRDTVLSLEVGTPEIYAYYHRAMYQLGVRDCYYLNLTYRFSGEMEVLKRINPTTIISIPSVLTCALPDILKIYHNFAASRLRRIIYMGEDMPLSMRNKLSERLGVQIFSFYGTTEIGGCAGECSAHRGHHLFYDYVVPTLVNAHKIDEASYEGEVFFTTLHLHAQPLVKYEVNDIVRLRFTDCPCGASYPLMEFVQRKFESFPLFGIKFRYKTFQGILQDHLNEVELYQIVVGTSNGNTTPVTFVFSADCVHYRAQIRRILSHVYEFDNLLKMKLIDLRLRFSSPTQLGTRKIKRIVDKRRNVSCYK